MSKIKWLSVDDPKEIYHNNQTSIIFKHSPRCIISRIVLKKFEYDYAPLSKIDNFYLVNVISERQISNELSHLYNLNHVVKQGPDGYLYALADEEYGAILRFERPQAQP